jgi:hypothetical protein
MSMPEVLRIHGHWWSVVLVPDLRDEDGVNQSGICDFENYTIKLDLGHPQTMRTALWHECLHACMQDLPEKTIAMIERETYAVINDNPALGPCLLGHAV